MVMWGMEIPLFKEFGEFLTDRLNKMPLYLIYILVEDSCDL